MDKQSTPDELFTFKDGRALMDERLSSIMYYIKSRQPEQFDWTSTGYEWNEMGMAELFSECYGDTIRYCPEVKSWFTYSEGAWRRDAGSLLVSEKMKEFVRLMGLYCWEIADEDKRKAYLEFVNRMGDRRFRDRVIRDAESECCIPFARFDNDPYLINCLNGTYDLRKMRFREHNPEDYLTMQTNFSHTVREDIRCERWEQFVDEVTEGNADKADFLQRALGYSMLGMANEECMFILHGKTTRNGKSTMLNTVQHLLGDYAAVSPVAIICQTGRSRDSGAADPMLAGLKGKRFVTMSESNQYGRLDEEAIKQMTGGEAITARALYSAPTTFKPQFTLWLSCNDLPSVSDKSIFASERIHVVEFNRHFAKDEQDKDLKTLFEQPESMQGIFMWLLRGYMRYKRNGLQMSEEMREVVARYERDNDVVLQFLHERTQRDEKARVSLKTLYGAYKLWANANGFKVMSSKTFAKNMASHPEMYGAILRPQNKVVYDGLALTSEIPI